LQDQIKALKLELEQLRAMKADVAELQLKTTKSQAQFESLNALSASVISLKDEMKQIRENLNVSGNSSRPSTPKPHKHSSM
jgi:predicted  nucleic acid-binding Zn-ribbon protein